jgi:hypothetical protein
MNMIDLTRQFRFDTGFCPNKPLVYSNNLRKAYDSKIITLNGWMFREFDSVIIFYKSKK